MNKKITVWVSWLILVIIWNFGWPNVPPIADVIVAAGLSLLSMWILKIWK